MRPEPRGLSLSVGRLISGQGEYRNGWLETVD